MWTILDVRRRGDVLLCVVRWVCPAKKTKPFALAEVSLTEAVVRWRDFASEKGARDDGNSMRFTTMLTRAACDQRTSVRVREASLDAVPA